MGRNAKRRSLRKAERALADAVGYIDARFDDPQGHKFCDRAIHTKSVTEGRFTIWLCVHRDVTKATIGGPPDATADEHARALVRADAEVPIAQREADELRRGDT